MATSFITSVYGRAETEYIVKESRFIATLAEVRSEAEAAACIEKLRKQYGDAKHNCYAYQIGVDGALQKSSDDGEPSGTAGRPMLETLKKSGITNTVVVVTRYFGGVKLGASGLIRAYSHAVTLGLQAADIADYKPYDIADVTVSYSFVSTLERMTPSFDILVADRAFSDTVTFTLQIPQERTEAFKAALIDTTNGTAHFIDKGSRTIPIIRPKNPQ